MEARRRLGAALYILAVIVLVGALVLLTRTPVAQDKTGCPPEACDPLPDYRPRQVVLGIGVAVQLVCAIGGYALRRRDSTGIDSRRDI